jgi:hypothetical protein
MAVTEKITCDVCGAEKQESNHWLLVGIGKYDGIEVQREFSVMPWGSEYRHLKHACGEGCAGKMLTQVIESWRN